MLAGMKAYRAAILSFDPDTCAPRYESDGLLVTGPGEGCRASPRIVRALGSYRELIHHYPGLDVEQLPDFLIAPGFIDLHVHYPQVDVIGSPADGLLPWLERHTFPQEARFSDPDYAAGVADFFLDELDRHGVTTALTFCTSHPQSVDALMQAAQPRGLRLIAGKCLQDRHCPDGVRDATEQSLLDTEALIGRWHGVGRLGYAITPRFAPSCSNAQLRGAGEIAARHPDVWIQSHVAENLDELAWVRELYPADRSYLSVYERFGLLRERAVYAHCLHLDEADRQLLRESGSAAAVCPTSNFFLGSGCFDFDRADLAELRYGLASDVGGGTSFSPFHTMLSAYEAGRASFSGGGSAKAGVSLAPSRLWWLHTAGAARALGLEGLVGNLAPGCEEDFVVIDPRATPLLARRTAQARDLEQLLFALIVLGDEHAVARTIRAGSLVD